ncbi:Serine/threonine-protein kinase PknD [Stieleria neptunia]|uniref:Serine/threonine-protein kinase PknD n=1 Tax=Stieleria neptunia TaxID=2527979 RepID=A0A518HPZ9_9BACT|nr:serine/threonine-protein kinase [Stieleria neptunia]QDV42901.1 Serine/threonine-protein kinase PknD [Stieleria neptunia]
METINGRFLPDDSDRPSSPPAAPPSADSLSDQPAEPPNSGDPDRTANQTPNGGAAAADPLATVWGIGTPPEPKRPPGESRGNAGTPHRQRETGLSDAECTLGSASAGRHESADSGEDEERPRDCERYVELGELGRGGWGVVQRALDRQLQREVAVKRISNPGKIQPSEREQFLHEARITSGLQHPGVVPVHELVADETGDTYYVMKLLEGDTLRHHIRMAHAKRPAGKWARHDLLEAITPLLLRFIDVCNAVAYAHRRGIIHRDLKPTNVMAGAFGETIVVDWGLARYIDDADGETTVQGPVKQNDDSGSYRSSAPMESEGSVVGTPTYMAPEQARGELASMGSHSDIYSLGVILYEIIAGTHPHKGLDIRSVLRRARDGEFTPLRELQPCVPKPLEEIVHTAMDPTAERRYGDVETLADDVQRFMTGLRVSVHDETLIERCSRWCGRHRALASTIGLAIVVLMIVSVISALVIRSAHQAERQARIEAREAHHESLERLVDARDTADTWLVDLSGSLQFHPAMTPLRNELIGQALNQYQRLIEQPIDPIADRSGDQLDADAFKTNTLVWLERVKCHLRLGDLHRMRGQVEPSKKQFAIAESILAGLGHAVDHITPVSLQRADVASELADTWFLHQPTLHELVCLEKVNTTIGRAMANEASPTLAAAIGAREQLQHWLPWEPPSGADVAPSHFVARAISALVRLEVVIERTQVSTSPSARRVFSADRYQNAVRWARWLADHRGNPSDLKLYETIATENAQRFSRLGDFSASHQAWTRLIDHLSDRLASAGERSDWMQSLAHAKLRRAEVAVQLGRKDEAAEDYASSIEDLERTWLLADADEFFRVNLATAENNLGRLWVDGNDQQRQQAKQLFARSIATYQQLLSESATPDILRRLALTHTAMAEAIDASTEGGDGDAAAKQLEHLQHATLAYEILRDQELLNDRDRLHWAAALVDRRQIDPDAVDPKTIRKLLAEIDLEAFTAAQRGKYHSLLDAVRSSVQNGGVE